MQAHYPIKPWLWFALYLGESFRRRRRFKFRGRR